MATGGGEEPLAEAGVGLVGVGARGRPEAGGLCDTLEGVEGCLGIWGPAPPPIILSMLKLLTLAPGLGDMARPGDMAPRCGE